MTFTPTFTYSVTVTITYTGTYTATMTCTGTYTDTPTASVSPTVTNTPRPYPYILVLEAYNEAGERIKLIGRTQIGSGINDVLLMAQGVETVFFNPVDSGLTISLPGVDSIGQTGGVTFNWDGSAENGGTVAQGDYYLKISVIDGYGHVNTVIKDIKVLKTEEYVQLSIYNSAGELVNRLVQNTGVAGTPVFEIEDIIITGEGAPPAIIKYSAAGYFQWDGMTMQGMPAGSGTYEAVLEVKNKDGYYTLLNSKTFTLMNIAGAAALDGLKAYPNPLVIYDYVFQPLVIDWPIKQQGEINARIYNTAGELVKVISGSLALAAGLSWDCTTENNALASSGLYIAVVKAVKQNGSTEMKILKFVIINRFDTGNNSVN